jgi:hypothetical protein
MSGWQWLTEQGMYSQGLPKKWVVTGKLRPSLMITGTLQLLLLLLPPG